MFDDQGRKRAWCERVYTEERVAGEFMSVFVIIKKVFFDAHAQSHTHTHTHAHVHTHTHTHTHTHKGGNWYTQYKGKWKM